jgi:hypothetical protein
LTSIGNKRLEPIQQVFINENIQIQVVQEFKLLGVVIDDKLNFIKHVSEQCLKINRKLFCIKLLFFLPNSVKIQFFKSFILPHFDYCITLSIYFSIGALQKLINSYYTCLFKLFKFNFCNLNLETINDYLKRFNLFAIQYRIFHRISLFSFKLLNQNNFPPNLSSCLKLKEQLYNLRNVSVYLLPSMKTTAGLQTFDYFFVKFVNCFYDILSIDFKDFKMTLLTNLNEKFKIFISKFSQFNRENKYSYNS